MTGRGLLLDLGGTAFDSGVERLALLGEREPAVRSIAARRGPLGPEPDPLCTYRAPHKVIDLPMERDKFGSAVEFRQMWTRESSIRYSPIRSDVLRLFGDPVPAWN